MNRPGLLAGAVFTFLILGTLLYSRSFQTKLGTSQPQPTASLIQTDCLALPEETNICTQPRSECIAQKVWENGDYELCKYHFDPKQCASWTVIKFKNFEACKNKEIFSGNYDAISFESSKLQFMEDVDKDYWSCYYRIVAWNNLQEGCSRIPFTEDSKRKCFEYHKSNQPDFPLQKGTWQVIGGSRCVE